MAIKKHVRVKVNGSDHEAEIEPRLLLVHFIREVLTLTGTHVGCDTTNCGACTVLLDGRAVKSCTVFRRAGGWLRDTHHRRRRQQWQTPSVTGRL